jgi:hypothetical protein
MVTQHEWTQSIYRAVDLLVRSRILLDAGNLQRSGKRGA